MGKIIEDRYFMPVNNMNKYGDHLFQIRGRGNPPVMHIDEIEGVIFKLYMETPFNTFYTKEKLDNGT